MTTRKNAVKVSIVGEEYTIRTEADPEHTIACAEYVDQTIRRVGGTGSIVDLHRSAILAALQITDELFTARRDSGVLAGEMDSLSEEVRRWLPPTKRS